MTNQIHWRSAHDSFTTDDIVPAKSLSDLMRVKTMAFTMYEMLNVQNIKFKHELELCDEYWWPYSLYMRWLIKKFNSRAINRIQRHYEKRMATIE